MRVTLPFASDGRVVAITDVHGEANLLRHALDNIRDPHEVHLVIGGDNFDRGDDSKGVAEILASLADRGFRKVSLLAGNHEQVSYWGLVDALDMPHDKSREYIERCSGTSLNSGGALTLREFGFDYEAVLAAIPEEIAKRIRGELPNYVEDGDLLFVHAGIDKGTADVSAFMKIDGVMDETGPLWIRDAFLEDERQAIGPRGNPVMVVHGHTRLGKSTPDGIREKTVRELERYGRLNLDNTESGHLAVADINGFYMDLTIIGPDGPVPEPDDGPQP